MTDARNNSAYVRACRGEATTQTPVWLNRQAGRYMPEYHAVKGDLPSLDFFKNPERAAQAAIDAQRILGVDAAILFADLLPILEPMGLQLEYQPGVGPVFHNPVRSNADIDALQEVDAPASLSYVQDTVRNMLSGLPADIPVIGFAGAPFTLASYAIEGGGSRNYTHMKRLMYSDPGAWAVLMDKINDAVAAYVDLQIDAGVHSVQLFDSWIGCLDRDDFRMSVMPWLKKLIERIRGRVPIVYFGTGNAHLVDLAHECGPDVMAIDWRTPLMETWNDLGCTAIQGNLDPIVLCADGESVERKAKELLSAVAGRPGHIFNLGHGIVPETPVDNVKRLVDVVQGFSA